MTDEEFSHLRRCWREPPLDWRRVPAELGLLPIEAEELFCPYKGHSDGLDTITPEQAAVVLRHLADTSEVDWSVAIPGYDRNAYND